MELGVPDFMDMEADQVVDWPTIANDPVRREHVLPWLRRQRDNAVESGLSGAKIEDVQYWRGYHDALKLVMEEPERQVLMAQQYAAAQAELAKKKEENARTVRFGPVKLRRLDTGWWNPGRRDRERVG